MLTPETSFKLREFFQTIGEFELQIEAQRQRIASIFEFEPYSAFMRLDRTGTKAITAIDIATFLQENGRPQYSAKDCEPVITYFDVDEDRCLSYQEFMQMVLPCDNLVLRADAAQR